MFEGSTGLKSNLPPHSLSHHFPQLERPKGLQAASLRALAEFSSRSWHQGAPHCSPRDPAPFQILDNTPESHVDHSSLKLALEQAEELCSQVNEGVREKENSDRLEWIQAHVQCDGLAEVRSWGGGAVGGQRCLCSPLLLPSDGVPPVFWGVVVILHKLELRFDSKRGYMLRWTVPGAPRRFHAGWVCRWNSPGCVC